MARQCELNVFCRRHGSERRRDLEGAAHSQPPDFARPQSDEAAIGKPHFPAIRRQLTVDDVEAGRLAAPFGPISARNSPSAISKLTFFIACTPPNALERLTHAENAHAGLLFAPTVGQRAHDAAGKCQHQSKDHQAKEPMPERRSGA